MSEWISVKEKFPHLTYKGSKTCTARVLVCIGKKVCEALFCEFLQVTPNGPPKVLRSEFYTLCKICGEDEILKKVTHWMPLPSPPEEE